MSDVSTAIRVLEESITNLRYIQPMREDDYHNAKNAIEILKTRIDLDEDDL